MEEPEPKETEAELERKYAQMVRDCEEWALNATDEEFWARTKPGNVPPPDWDEYERRFGPIPE